MTFRTKQRETLLQFLTEHPDEFYTARQIADALIDQTISLSSVYRNLALLEKAGVLQKRVNDAKEVTYRYAHAHGCEGLIHLTCIHCGKTYHMSSALSDTLERELMNKDSFAVDKTHTTLYGICKDCNKS